MQKDKGKRGVNPELCTVVTQEMYDELIVLLSGTPFQSLNELCRQIITGKRVKATFIDGTPDKLLADLSSTYKQLQQNCAEIYQLTQLIHDEQSPEGLIKRTREAGQMLTDINELLEPMPALMASIAHRWLTEEELGFGS